MFLRPASSAAKMFTKLRRPVPLAPKKLMAAPAPARLCTANTPPPSANTPPPSANTPPPATKINPENTSSGTASDPKSAHAAENEIPPTGFSRYEKTMEWFEKNIFTSRNERLLNMTDKLTSVGFKLTAAVAATLAFAIWVERSVQDFFADLLKGEKGTEETVGGEDGTKEAEDLLENLAAASLADFMATNRFKVMAASQPAAKQATKMEDTTKMEDAGEATAKKPEPEDAGEGTTKKPEPEDAGEGTTKKPEPEDADAEKMETDEQQKGKK